MNSHQHISDEAKQIISNQICLQLTDVWELSTTFNMSSRFIAHTGYVYMFQPENLIEKIFSDTTLSYGLRYRSNEEYGNERLISPANLWHQIKKDLVIEKAIREVNQFLRLKTELSKFKGEEELSEEKSNPQALIDYAAKEYENISRELFLIQNTINQIKGKITQFFIVNKKWIDAKFAEAETDEKFHWSSLLHRLKYLFNDLQRVKISNLDDLNTTITLFTNLQNLISSDNFLKSTSNDSLDNEFWTQLTKDITLDIHLNFVLVKLQALQDSRNTEEKRKEQQSNNRDELNRLKEENNKLEKAFTTTPSYLEAIAIRMLGTENTENGITINSNYELNLKIRLIIVVLNDYPLSIQHHNNELRRCLDVLLNHATVTEIEQRNLEEISLIKNTIRKDYPFCFAYQRLRLRLLSKCDEGILMTNLYNDLESLCAENEKTESEKLLEFEKFILDAYFKARKQPELYGTSAVADELEIFIKHWAGLDLVRKYGIDIPHQIKSNDFPPQVLTPVTKRIAFVALSAIKNDNGFNQQLIDKLKLEYNEVILYSEALIPKEIQNQLKELGVYARINVPLEPYDKNENTDEAADTLIDNVKTHQSILPSLDKLQKFVIKENPGWKTEVSIFDTSLQELNKLNDKRNIKTDGREKTSSRFDFKKYWINPMGHDCYPLPQNKKIIQSEIIQNIQPNYLELNQALEKYIVKRRLEANLSKKDYQSIFGRIIGMSAQVKIDAAKNVLAEISRKNTYSTKDFEALTQGRLGRLMLKYKEQLPPVIRGRVIEQQGQRLRYRNLKK